MIPLDYNVDQNTRVNGSTLFDGQIINSSHITFHSSTLIVLTHVGHMGVIFYPQSGIFKAIL